jgi:hypothetical protein
MGKPKKEQRKETSQPPIPGKPSKDRNPIATKKEFFANSGRSDQQNPNWQMQTGKLISD